MVLAFVHNVLIKSFLKCLERVLNNSFTPIPPHFTNEETKAHLEWRNDLSPPDRPWNLSQRNFESLWVVSLHFFMIALEWGYAVNRFQTGSLYAVLNRVSLHAYVSIHFCLLEWKLHGAELHCMLSSVSLEPETVPDKEEILINVCGINKVRERANELKITLKNLLVSMAGFSVKFFKR